MRPQDRPRIQSEVRHRVVDRHDLGTQGKGGDLESVLFETAYQEDRRLDDEKRTPETLAQRRYWRRVLDKTVKGSDSERKSLLNEVVKSYVEEITGNFDERVYNLATRVLPYDLGFLLNTVSPKEMLRQLPRLPSLSGVVDRIFASGEIELCRTLEKKGTLILCPTHSSNLDSLVIGWLIYSLGLPPFTYGAGLNLFESPLLSYFMNNLGAYKVDRKKRNVKLYLEVLKEYATASLEMGYHNLFFPGGTRSRSGRLERHLKLGLMGCGLTAYINNLRNGSPRPRVFVVPCTINYPIVLESRTLILDALRSEGKSRFIITDDEFSRPRTIINFIESLLGLDARIEVRLGPALDPFGNRVLADGSSVDGRGRPIAIERYVQSDGAPSHEATRDAEYTRELGRAVAESYSRHSIICMTHVAALAALTVLRRRNPSMDIYHIVRTGGRGDGLQRREVEEEIGRLQRDLVALEARGELMLAEEVRLLEPRPLLEKSLHTLNSYHRPSPLASQGTHLVSDERHVLVFYANRLDGYGVDGGVLQ